MKFYHFLRLPKPESVILEFVRDKVAYLKSFSFETSNKVYDGLHT